MVLWHKSWKKNSDEIKFNRWLSTSLITPQICNNFLIVSSDKSFMYLEHAGGGKKAHERPRSLSDFIELTHKTFLFHMQNYFSWVFLRYSLKAPEKRLMKKNLKSLFQSHKIIFARLPRKREKSTGVVHGACKKPKTWSLPCAFWDLWCEELFLLQHCHEFSMKSQLCGYQMSLQEQKRSSSFTGENGLKW